jgi:hypothetical protein
MNNQKKLSIDGLETEQQKIYQILEERCPEGFVKDGIVDYSLYHRRADKILWILKETNDPGGNTRDLCKFLQDPARYNHRWKQTWGPVVAVSYGIIEGITNGKFPIYSEIESDIENKIATLKEIAVINVNKRNGSSNISWVKLSSAFQEFREDILAQIDYINPDIIIGGNTLGLFAGHLAPINSLEQDGRLWVAAWHPAQRQKCSREEYYNSVITLVKAWYRRKSN